MPSTTTWFHCRWPFSRLHHGEAQSARTATATLSEHVSLRRGHSRGREPRCRFRSAARRSRSSTRADVDLEDLKTFSSFLKAELAHADIEVVPPSDPSARASARVAGTILNWDPGLRPMRFVSRGCGTGRLDSTWEVEDTYSDSFARCRIEASVSMGTFGGELRSTSRRHRKGARALPARRDQLSESTRNAVKRRA